ncbi:hypothetical protein [Deferrisoma sp.]
MKRASGWNWTVVLGVVGALLASSASLGGAAEPPADVYCQAAIASLQQDVQALGELIQLLESYGGDPESLAEWEQAHWETLNREKTELLQGFGMTLGEYVRYVAANRKAYDAYLAEHPDVRSQIQALVDEAEAKLARVEELKTATTATAPPGAR